MTKIIEAAKEYEPATTANIADLEKVSTQEDIVEKTYKEGTDDEFKIKVITLKDVDYRVPNTVLASLKSIAEEKPDLQTFKVKKNGEGLKTTYTVIPLE